MLHFINFHVFFQTGEIKCDECDNLFIERKHLERHKSLEHSKNDVYICSECSVQVTNKEKFMEHMKTHPFSKPYSCRYCKREFTRKYHLDRHTAQKGCDGAPKNEFQCQVSQISFQFSYFIDDMFIEGL